MISRDVFSRVKVAGILAVIPIVLAAGPISGYIVADILISRLGLPALTSAALMMLGLAGSLFETARIIRLAMKIKG